MDAMKLRARSVNLANDLAMGLMTYRSRLFVQASFWIAAVLVGLAAVYFTKFITIAQAFNTEVFEKHPYWMSAFTPVAFVAATAICKYLAPHAGGSGIPQVLHAASLPSEAGVEITKTGILSVRTAIVKVASTGIGLIGGASIGGEGPTVQISGSIFAVAGNYIRKYFPKVDFHSYIVAAAGAGIASAFNTPLGGVVFALEEVAIGDFGKLRHLVMLGVIIAGLTAQALEGDKLYFGHFALVETPGMFLVLAIFIGAVGGLCGAVFSRVVSSDRLYRLKINWWQRALGCGVAVSVIGLTFSLCGFPGATAGSGYESTRAFMLASSTNFPIFLPLGKMAATAFSTLSGMGGGILAPSLSIGAFLGAALGKLVFLSDPRVCALLGMVAYFTGAFQIPMTAVIVVMEMTAEHDLIIPMMVAGLTAFLVARVVMPVPLYHLLVERSFKKKTLSD